MPVAIRIVMKTLLRSLSIDIFLLANVNVKSFGMNKIGEFSLSNGQTEREQEMGSTCGSFSMGQLNLFNCGNSHLWWPSKKKRIRMKNVGCTTKLLRVAEMSRKTSSHEGEKAIVCKSASLRYICVANSGCKVHFRSDNAINFLLDVIEWTSYTNALGEKNTQTHIQTFPNTIKTIVCVVKPNGNMNKVF